MWRRTTANTTRGDIFVVMRTAVECLEELVKLGYKVSLGKLGSIYPSVSSTGPATREEFTGENIRALSVNWDRPKRLDDIKDGVTFNKVPSRAVQAALMKNLADYDIGEMLEHINAFQKNDSAVLPDDGSPNGGNDTGGGGSSGGSDQRGEASLGTSDNEVEGRKSSSSRWQHPLMSISTST